MIHKQTKSSYSQLPQTEWGLYARQGLLHEIAAATSLVSFQEYPRYRAFFTLLGGGVKLPDALKETGLSRLISSHTNDNIICLKSNLHQNNHLENLCHLAGYISLFDGMALSTPDTSEMEFFKTLARNTLPAQFASDTYAKKVADSLNYADAVRTVMLLLLLGKYLPASKHTLQLSLGAARGDKDRFYVHSTPTLQESFSPNSETADRDSASLIFRLLRSLPRSTVLIDNDIAVAQYYEQLNADKNNGVYAINSELGDGLERLLAAIETGLQNKCNFIAALKFDHRMLPKASTFFTRLAEMTSPDWSLLFSVGSGNTDQEYIGRIKKVREYFDYLSSNNYQPTLFKCHKQGSPKKSRKTPSFGLPTYASYEILHCAPSQHSRD